MGCTITCRRILDSSRNKFHCVLHMRTHLWVFRVGRPCISVAQCHLPCWEALLLSSREPVTYNWQPREYPQVMLERRNSRCRERGETLTKARRKLRRRLSVGQLGSDAASEGTLKRLQSVNKLNIFFTESRYYDSLKLLRRCKKGVWLKTQSVDMIRVKKIIPGMSHKLCTIQSWIMIASGQHCRIRNDQVPGGIASDNEWSYCLQSTSPRGHVNMSCKLLRVHERSIGGNTSLVFWACHASRIDHSFKFAQRLFKFYSEALRAIVVKHSGRAGREKPIYFDLNLRVCLYNSPFCLLFNHHVPTVFSHGLMGKHVLGPKLNKAYYCLTHFLLCDLVRCKTRHLG